MCLKKPQKRRKAIAATRLTYSKFERVETYCIIHNVVLINLYLRVPLYFLLPM